MYNFTTIFQPVLMSGLSIVISANIIFHRLRAFSRKSPASLKNVPGGQLKRFLIKPFSQAFS